MPSAASSASAREARVADAVKTPAPAINVEVLAHRHDHADTMAKKWERYRAFTGSLETDAEKSGWIPKGSIEDHEDYAVRVKLTEHLGWSEPCVARMAGTLTKTSANYTFPNDSKIAKADQDRIHALSLIHI